MTTAKFGKSIRHLWHLEPDCIFLNNGSFGATPKTVLAAQQAWQLRLESQPVRFMTQELAPALRSAAANLANFVGAKPENLVFVENATAGINTVLRSLNFQPGDTILTTTHLYGAVRNALNYVCQRHGLNLVAVDIPFPIQQPAQVLQAIAQASADLNLATVKLLLIDHITSPTALVLPLAEIIKWAHAHSIPVLVDGAHAPGSIPLNLESLQADWYVGNCHKWLFAPKGCGFLVTLPVHQAITHPLVISHGLGSGYQAEFEWVGTRDFSAWLAITEAIAFYQHFDKFDPYHIYNHNHYLALQAAQLLAQAWGTTLPAPESMLGAMVALPVTAPSPSGNLALDSDRLHNSLWQKYQIEVPIIPFANQLWLRISAQIYNEMSDYQELAAKLVEIQPQRN